MKQIVKYHLLTIPNKIRCDIRLVYDETKNADYVIDTGDTKSTNITFYPYIGISMIRPYEINEEGRRVSAPLNPNDYTSLTKYSLPIFIRELSAMMNDMKTPDLFTYHGSRLELNESLAAKIRKVFMNGQMTIELSAVVDVQSDESRVEAIKMKFNNEQSSVVMTLNDITALLYTLENVDVSTLALTLYNEYIDKSTNVKGQSNVAKPIVDILPI